jgi:hypothetical protein
MILEAHWNGFWTLSFELSQLHGRGSWLVCEVALSDMSSNLYLRHLLVSFKSNWKSNETSTKLFYFRNIEETPCGVGGPGDDMTASRFVGELVGISVAVK